jgi:hypothetical protein
MSERCKHGKLPENPCCECDEERGEAQSSFTAPTGSEVPRIYTRCPACHNDTLTINRGHLLCTWHVCPYPTLIDRIGNVPPNAAGEPQPRKPRT